MPRNLLACLVLPFAASLPLALYSGAQNPTSQAPPPASATAAPASRISPQKAAVLFRSVDTILRFDARDTGYEIYHDVKRKLMTREEVVAFLKEKMDEDKDTARIERSAIVLEKFGLLPQHFALRDFLLKVLGEQVAGFYDSKTKTVNLLDWIDADTQKPVLAHELTHALQDQYQGARHIDLDKWENAGPDGTATNVAEDREHLRYDETDTAREAVLEGQAMVAYLDWGLDGQGRSVRTMPDIPLDSMSEASSRDSDSPVLDSAPLVLRESLLFPYQEGLVFEQRVLKAAGTAAAFADALKRPPDTSWEILHPDAYLRGEHPPLLAMPDLHPLLDAQWAPYDVGVMGALDVRMLGEALADKGAGADAALAWDGGEYYAAQARSATTAAEKNSTASIALVYLSRWKTAAAAAAFSRMYENSLVKRYTATRAVDAKGTRSVYSTEEGPVVIDRRDRYVFLSHSLPVELSGEIADRMIAAQTSPAAASIGDELSAPARRFFAEQGAMRAGLGHVAVAGPRVY